MAEGNLLDFHRHDEGTLTQAARLVARAWWTHPAARWRVVATIVLFFVAWAWSVALLAEPRLVGDLRPGPESSLFDVPGCGHNPVIPPPPTPGFWFEDAAPFVLGAIHRDDVGAELFRLDPVNGGLALVADLIAGAEGGLAMDCGPVTRLPVAGGWLFGSGEQEEYYLWWTDGTAEQTVPLGVQTSDPVGLLEDSVRLGDDVVWADRLLFRSDGTPEGTGLVYEILPGENIFPVSATDLKPVFGGFAFGGFLQGEDRRSVWWSDGTANGTRLLHDVPFAFFAAPRTSVLVIWSGDDLLRSDGTSDVLERIGTVPRAQSFWFSKAIGDTIYFVTWDGGTLPDAQLWRTDGTAEGTGLVVETNLALYTRWHAAVGDRVLFEGRFEGNDRRFIYASDGTLGGTVPLIEVAATSSGVGLFPSLVEDVPLGDGRIGLAVPNGTASPRLWVTDGTPAGTRIVDRLCPTDDDCAPTGLAAIGNSVIYGADDGVHGREPWIIDSVSRGAVPIPTLGDAGFAILASILVVMGLAVLRWRAD